MVDLIFLETNRLVLRQLEYNDLDTMYDYRNHILCSRYQRGQSKGYNEIKALIEKHHTRKLSSEDYCILAVAAKETDDMIGEIVVMPNDGCFSLGYTFSYKHHRKGYAFEALSALTDMLHGVYPDMEFISFVEPENIASVNLLKKLGYTDYGYIEKLTSNLFGKWVIGNPLE